MKKNLRDFEDKMTDILPCKPGDTIYLVDTVDCKSGECADSNTSVCKHALNHRDTEGITACKEQHPIIREVLVDEISASLFQLPDKEEYAAMVFINDTYGFTSDMLDQIKKTYEGAAALIEEE